MPLAGRPRRRLLAAVLGVSAALVVLASLASLGLSPVSPAPGGSVADGPADADPGPAADPAYRFVSAPDFMNADVADLRVSPRWRPGTPDSWNASWAAATDTVMDAFAAEEPQDVLVAGDLVNGHWGAEPTRVFGPVSTEAERRAAVRRAAAVYYPAWFERFAERGLSVLPAIGDHEIGDNDWRGSVADDRKRRLVPVFKQQLAARLPDPGPGTSRPPGPAHGTAYAVRPTPDVQLVSVDVFELTADDVVTRLDRQQLAWLDDVLADAESDGVRWTIVQGHVPVAWPVRRRSSSGLHYRGGTASPFWRTLARHDVDLYLAGEVHDLTAVRRDGVLQVTHGGMFGHPGRRGVGGTSYLVGQTSGDALTLTAKRFRVAATSPGRELWQATGQGRPPLAKRFVARPDVVGTLRLTSEGRTLTAAGRLARRGPPAP